MTIRRWLCAGLCLAFSVLTQGQVRVAGNEQTLSLRDDLIGTSWVGTALGSPLECYLLDQQFAICISGEDQVRKGSWYPNGRQVGLVLPKVGPEYSPSMPRGNQPSIIISGVYQEQRIVGTVAETGGEKTPLILEQASAPSPSMVSATPSGRPVPTPEGVNVSAFDGIYEAPARSVPNSPPERAAEVRCEEGRRCIVRVGKNPGDIFDRVVPLTRSTYSEAYAALQYAQDHRGEAVRAVPALDSVLTPSSRIEACIDLQTSLQQGSPLPGMTILCAIEKGPTLPRTLLLMGTRFSNCGPAFCRYDLLPVFPTDERRRLRSKSVEVFTPIAVGDGVDVIQKRFGVTQKPTPNPHAWAGEEWLMLSKAVGVLAYFKEGLVSRIYLTQPDAGQVGGVRVGDSVGTLDKLFGHEYDGTPERRVYDIDAKLAACFDVRMGSGTQQVASISIQSKWVRCQ